MTARKFAVFDIDGTLIRWQLYHAIANTLAKRGFFKPQTDKAIREARMVWKRREHDESFKNYEKQLVLAYDEMLASLTMEQFKNAAQTVFDEYKDQVYTYTRDLMRKLKSDGYILFAVSGSPIEIVEKISRHHGFDDFEGTVHEYKNDHFTGKKKVIAHDKLAALQGLVLKHKVTWKGSVAVGDTSSDIPMLEAVNNPIAFNPEKDLFVHAKSKGWKVVIERKNMIYSLEKTNGKYLLAETD